MRTKDELKRDIEDVARQVGISEDAIDAIVNGKPLPQQKREPRIKKWNSGWELRELIFQHHMQFVFFDAVIEDKLTPYDENGLEIIDSAIHNPFGPNPPGCRYETITYDNVYDFFYKKEDIEKFLKPLEEQKANPLPADQAATLPPVKTIEPKYATPDQEKKYDAREIAKKYIRGCKKGSVPSIKEAVAKVKAKLAGSHYTEDTIRNWIKDLFPPESRKPGRRPKKP